MLTLRTPARLRRVLALLMPVVLAAAACDEPTEEEKCADAEEALEAFLADNRSCQSDDDCTTVGDCGPHIWHEPVNVQGAEGARRLQLETCRATYDGPTDGTRCDDGVCVRVPNAGECCGCDREDYFDAGDEDDGGG